MPEVGDSVLRHVGWAWTRGRADQVCDQLAYHRVRNDRAIAAFLVTAADGAVAVGANPEAIAHLRALWTSVGGAGGGERARP